MRTETTSVGLKDFIQRSLDGPVMRDLDFDLKLSRQVRRITSEYSIHFKPGEIVCDDATADSIWQAALELLEKVGIYNIDTNRVVLLAKEEVTAAAARAPKELVVGEGKDAVAITARSGDSKGPPPIIANPVRSFRHKGGSNVFLARMLDAYKSDSGELGEMARELKSQLEGVPLLADTPGEMIWARALVRWQRALASQMGKPGLWLSGTEVTSPPAILACFVGDGLLNRFNAHISLSLMPELKINWDRLKLAAAAQDIGVYRSCSADPILGGYCRNNEEAAVLAAATLLGYIAYAGDRQTANINVVDLKGNRSTRGPLQASAGARLAVVRNLGIPMLGTPDTRNGLGTAMSVYELAALTIAQVGSGMAWAGRGYACGPGPDGQYRVDLDGQLVARVSRGASRLSRATTNELLLKLLEITEGHDRPDEGRPFAHYYDARTLTPSPELAALYATAQEELQELGVPLG
ncbi:MAG: monomethylamine:corrinoid methyltransferase [Chloroflexi bacterium]|nr:monomethylamine:corrinoid methyltransferase [Chloroflexota bacterium]